MGSCVSVHKDQESAMKLRLSYGSKKDKLVIPGGGPTVTDVALKSNPIYNVRDFGSKEETFFDCQPWLDSECEDDFSSIDSDFIPSRGITPVHHNAVGNPVSITVSFPAEKKKKLFDLFTENLQVDGDLDEQNAAGNLNVDAAAEVKAERSSVVLPAKSAEERPNFLGANFAYTGERSSNVVFRQEDKSVRSCLPRLISSRSFSERKKRRSRVQSF